ncbi:hypothetical protein [Nostoc sp.]
MSLFSEYYVYELSMFAGSVKAKKILEMVAERLKVIGVNLDSLV